eukprot:9239895-Pyramimonas_sp.AAC.1
MCSRYAATALSVGVPVLSRLKYHVDATARYVRVASFKRGMLSLDAADVTCLFQMIADDPSVGGAPDF